MTKKIIILGLALYSIQHRATDRPVLASMAKTKIVFAEVQQATR